MAYRSLWGTGHYLCRGGRKKKEGVKAISDGLEEGEGGGGGGGGGGAGGGG